MKPCDIVIIGAGPYGLSIAAHLRALGVNFRIFGRPMQTWLDHMPKGMKLKSEGFASCLYDPDSSLTLSTYCKARGLPYADTGLPVPLETFAAYGLEFQRQFVPDLENRQVVGLEREGLLFQVDVEGGETVAARRVVVAVGLTYYQYLPPIFEGLPETHVSHSSRHAALDHFNGREVTVVGAGSSAFDLAALLHQAGARVQVVARKPTVNFYDPPPKGSRSLVERIRNPLTGIGTGWRMFLCAEAPLVFRLMPEQFRLEKVRLLLGPGPGWFIKEDVVGKVPLQLGFSIKEVKVNNGSVRLQLADAIGATRTLETQHIIAATGYRVDLRRLAFLNPADLAGIKSVEHTPVLSSNFESSLPGLYFVGSSAANTFGPLLRFAVGAKFTARRLARHLARTAVRN